MSAQYEEVLRILHEERGWAADAAPEQSYTEQALADGMAVSEVVNRCDAVVNNAFASGIYPTKWQASYSLFRGREYIALDTAIVLGLQPPDPPVDTIGEAKTVSEWYSNLAQGRNRNGERNGTLEAYAERKARGYDVPEEWQATPEMARLYQLLVWEGYQLPRVQSVRGLDRQQWLDNLRAVDAGAGRDVEHPLPWQAVQPAKAKK